MKKLLTVGLLTIGALAISEPQARAWVNSRFSIGLNWHHQSGNTSYLWGLWRNGQIPGPEAFGPGPGGPGPGGPGPGMFGPPPGGQPFPFLGQGAMPNGMPPGMVPNGMATGPINPSMFQFQPGGMFAPNALQGFGPMPMGSFPANMQETAPPPPAQPPASQPGNSVMNGVPNPFQAVSYQNSNYSYGYNYYQPYYYMPSYNYEVPYYWYGGR